MSFLNQTGVKHLTEKIKEWAAGKFVDKTRKVNGKALSADITLSATDVGAIPTSAKGAANGVASLDGTGKVPAAQLPSYVDDVLEGYLHTDGKFYKEAAHTTALTAESGKIYVNLTNGVVYRWSGTAYVEISASLALGETASTAFPGDKGKTAYAHSQASHARTDATKVEKSTNGKIKINGTDVVVYEHSSATPKTSGLYKITVDSQGHVSGTAAVTKDDITDLGIPKQDTNTTYSVFDAATAGGAGSTGLVPQPAAGAHTKFLRGDGTWQAAPDPEAITNAEIDALFTA